MVTEESVSNLASQLLLAAKNESTRYHAALQTPSTPPFRQTNPSSMQVSPDTESLLCDEDDAVKTSVKNRSSSNDTSHQDAVFLAMETAMLTQLRDFLQAELQARVK